VDLKKLYLETIKKTLSFSLWPEPPLDLEKFNYSLNPIKRFAVSIITFFTKNTAFKIVKERQISEQDRNEGKFFPPGYGHTMVGMKRLNNIQYCIEQVIKNNIEGDLIETGVWRGGACIFMRAVLAAYEINDRRVYAADSFEGLPKPDTKRWSQDKHDKNYSYKFLAVSKEEVEDNFRKFGLLDNQVIFLKGFFSDTLPRASIDKIAILRLDGDMYESTMVALDSLYPKLSKGGYCIVDDYSLKGARSAVIDYRTKNNIEEPIEIIDWTGVYWKK
jgi:O-methyltransferase